MDYKMKENMSYMQMSLPNYSYVLNLEKNFIYWDTVTPMNDHLPYCLVYCAIYVILVFSGKYYLSDKPKFDLRRWLTLWSLMLATFSILGFLRMGSEMFHTLSNYGFYYSVCVPNFLTRDPVAAFWTFSFTLSKIVELGDTAFIVLRKQPLIFLHWYHHITVLLYTWYSYGETSATGRWFTTMNLFVHSWMYSYYALKAMRFSLPKWIAITITMLQLLQMVIGCVIVFAAYYYMQINECNVTLSNIKFSLLMYFSYFILFARFFQKAYLSNESGDKAKKAYANKTSSNDKIKIK
ncbi:elongation of very long chain fatty acids protein 6-like [Bombus vosnesenskii]|uniref:Elongation of very long chain fatty acids protein n=1 Tax=Bombus vosnesenskii TaxID=207650 RepID=A0A6J3KQK1_9HYME|nr:elongation of very long chain fatty acids protein 6-like [Bombus vosnesenskii]XP_033355329.1 elongation of very long chain fatty acids protein 6-like [Bombus vosnesenskii]XP_033355330.1 elongation of very long chain fatty acids protein 6-like [Bombus vosnesenskii]